MFFCVIFSFIVQAIINCFQHNKLKAIKVYISLAVLAIMLDRSYHVLKGEELYNLVFPLVISILDLIWLNREKRKNNPEKIEENRRNTKVILLAHALAVLIAFICMAYSKLFSNEYETVLHIFVKYYETAKEVISKFESGHDFCDLVVEYSLDKDTHDKCGNLKYSAYEGILLLVPRPEVIENFFVYTTEPYETVHGYHIIMWKN